MPRYIDALEIRYTSNPRRNDEIAYRDEIEKIPTADVAPVLHAHWVRTRLCNECSLCRGGWLGLPETKFCPNCGAKMDEQITEE